MSFAAHLTAVAECRGRLADAIRPRKSARCGASGRREKHPAAGDRRQARHGIHCSGAAPAPRISGFGQCGRAPGRLPPPALARRGVAALPARPRRTRSTLPASPHNSRASAYGGREVAGKDGGGMPEGAPRQAGTGPRRCTLPRGRRLALRRRHSRIPSRPPSPFPPPPPPPFPSSPDTAAAAAAAAAAPWRRRGRPAVAAEGIKLAAPRRAACR